MEQVTLLDGMFKKSQEKGKEYLLYLDIDRLMAPCYEGCGKKAKKERYGGWERTGIAGHSIGHWLSAAATMYDATGDKALMDKIDYALTELMEVQSYDQYGFVAGFSRDCFDRVFSGEFEVDNFSLGGSWVPWYSLHKIYAGLIDVYKITASKLALKIVEKLADWAYNGLKNLTNEQIQRMLICEHGGMNDVFAELYLITKDERHLELAELFFHEVVLEPLANNQDSLEGKHANTQIPKVIGVAKLYNVTKKEKYKQIATYFWNQVVYTRTYAIGGNSIREHFGPENAEELGILTTETCNTYNMLKLTEILFRWEESSRYYDYYERALYNHILASQDPDSGMKTYFVSSEPGHFKVYHSCDHSFWCCTGTGMENPARYNQRIFERIADRLYVHLFIPAKASDHNDSLIVRQETSFPYKANATITMEKIDDEVKEIAIRKPNWLSEESVVQVNGKQVHTIEENGYLIIQSPLKNGDQISVQLPLDLHRYYAKDDKKKQVIMYGPIVLAGALGRENFPETDIVDDHQSLNNHPLIDVPTLVTDRPLHEWITVKDEEQLLFETTAIGHPGNKQMLLKPFYDLHHERYTIYWDIMSEQEFNDFGDSERKRKAHQQKIIVDEVTPHEQQPEVDHQFRSKNSYSGYSNDVHSGWRDARDGGYFSYQLKVDPTKEMYVAITFNKSDFILEVDGKKMKREFEIKIDDYVLAKEHFNKPNIGELYTKTYPVPASVIEGKEYITITFQAEKNKVAGGIYHVRMLNEPSL
ncbi:glycoside hydrolase family 127 protein [Gracilibacillus sp. S3-1-1]|uniref:Glycoside hydrolase family 127 protein n=1 Tax=Gracilibacillus pellucidus TaxID=3095368 RepID=A0ACC6M8W3_9BACI|nr:beta-L-arabinofuranosidase domain-containing protein [Gracilibacillus sp. S3-1-1]MDX8047421.1 glycoside hydrolase family 127 protein [Gracilibacillus sp. S3-1-1]